MRYERKYRIEHLKWWQVEQLIKLHPAGLYRLYPDRSIHNIYFDTLGLTTFNENVIGIADRKKFRVRWYGDNVYNIQNPKLEIKIKTNQLGVKESFSIPAFSLQEIDQATQSIQNLKQVQTSLEPKLLNSYTRSYYSSPDQKFRLTIDRDMKYQHPNNFINYHAHDNDTILEVKYDREYDDVSEYIFQHLPFRQTKNSKYVKGLFALHSSH